MKPHGVITDESGRSHGVLNGGRGGEGEEDKGREKEEEIVPSATPSEIKNEGNIFSLYENNIGLISSLIADELKEAEKLYPASWIEDAFKVAVEMNKRNWRYIHAILKRWAAEGKDDGKSKGHRGKRGLPGRGSYPSPDEI